MAEPEFRRDLYEGVAESYEQFRPPYPRHLFDDLLGRAGIAGGAARLLDLACGTGQIAFALHGAFREVWAVDQEPEMIAFARRKAERLAIGNIRWHAQRAEDLAAGAALFDLVTIGNAFHRLRRRHVAEQVRHWLTPGRFVALLWSDNPWTGDDEWQVVASEAVREWMAELDATDRVPGTLGQAIAEEPHEAVLVDNGLEVVGKFEFPTRLRWTPHTIAGFARSTSVLSPGVLGDRAPEFAADLRDRLLRVDPSGVFHQMSPFAYQLARRPD